MLLRTQVANQCINYLFVSCLKMQTTATTFEQYEQQQKEIENEQHAKAILGDLKPVLTVLSLYNSSNLQVQQKVAVCIVYCILFFARALPSNTSLCVKYVEMAIVFIAALHLHFWSTC